MLGRPHWTPRLLRKDDAFCCYFALAEQGLDIGTTHAEDVALLLHCGHPWTPCLWAEVETTATGLVYCTHLTDKSEKIIVPKYFRHEWSLAHYAAQDEAGFNRRMRHRS